MRALLLAVTVLAAVLATGAHAEAQRLTPHVPSWERYFTVSWETFERRGRPHLNGYVVSQYGAPAQRIQLLVESLDSSGQVVAQRLQWMPGEVAPFSRGYFQVPVPEPAPRYQVRVYAFDFIQAALVEAP